MKIHTQKAYAQRGYTDSACNWIIGKRMTEGKTGAIIARQHVFAIMPKWIDDESKAMIERCFQRQMAK